MIFARSLNDATFTKGTNACLCPCYHGKKHKQYSKHANNMRLANIYENLFNKHSIQSGKLIYILRYSEGLYCNIVRRYITL